MSITKGLFKRAVIVATGAALLVGASSASAEAAATYSTTGAWGESVFVSGTIGSTVYNLYAKDTLEDGHCAQFQFKNGSGAWNWYGTSVCTGTVTYAGKAYGRYGYYYRICRTGVGNCSATFEVA